MHSRRKDYLLLFTMLMLCTAGSVDAQVFGDRIDKGLIESPLIDEASGIAGSHKNVDVLWTHNDSGDFSRVFAMNVQGEHLGIYTISGIPSARDWEDIAVGPGPISDSNYVYIGDIGDNSSQYDLKFIHRVLEPDVSSAQSPIDSTLANVETITFEYPDGNRDAETLMVDPFTKDIFVVSKREDSVRVYRLAYPQSTVSTLTAEHVLTLGLDGGQVPPQSWTVAGEISESGTEILIKTRSTIYHWSRLELETVHDALAADPVEVTYVEEPQGEAVGWAGDDSGYYTVSEEPGGVPARLYFYPREVELAIALSDFVAYRDGKAIVLQWWPTRTRTNSEYNVERYDSGRWKGIGTVVPIGTRGQGTSYSFVDVDARPGVGKYRLSQIAVDGALSYSRTISVGMGDTGDASRIWSTYPNPFRTETVLTYHLARSSDVVLHIYDTTGREVQTLVQGIQEAGTHDVRVSGASLPTGVYFVRLDSGNSVSTSKILLVK